MRRTTISVAISLAVLGTAALTTALPVTAQDPDEAPAATMATPDTGAAVSTDARVIDLTVPAGLGFTQNGERILDIPVTPGESVLIRVDNAASRGFEHNFYIGTDSQLSTPPSQEELIAFIEAEKEAGRKVDLGTLDTYAATDVGIPAWDTGVRYVEWLVPADITDLKFGCTVTRHYPLMQGTFSVSS
jgi:hypothetical protein